MQRKFKGIIETNGIEKRKKNRKINPQIKVEKHFRVSKH